MLVMILQVYTNHRCCMSMIVGMLQQNTVVGLWKFSISKNDINSHLLPDPWFP